LNNGLGFYVDDFMKLSLNLWVGKT